MPIFRGFGGYRRWKKGWVSENRFEILSIVNDDSVLDPVLWKVPPHISSWDAVGPLSGGAVYNSSYVVYPLKLLSNIMLGLSALGFIFAFYGTVNWLAFDSSVPLIIAGLGIVMMPLFWWAGGVFCDGFNRVYPFFYRHCVIFDRKRGLVHMPHWRRGWDRVRWQDVEFMLFDRPQRPFPIATFNYFCLLRPPFSILSRKFPFFWRRIEICQAPIDAQYQTQLDVKRITEYMNGNESRKLKKLHYGLEGSGTEEDDDRHSIWWEDERWPAKALYEYYKKVGWEGLDEMEQINLSELAPFAKIDPDKLPGDPTWWRDEEGNWVHVSKKPIPKKLPVLRKTSYFRDRNTEKIIIWRGSRQLEDILDKEYGIPKFDENDVDWEARERHFKEKYGVS